MSVLNTKKTSILWGGPWKTKNIVFYGFNIIIRICEYKNVTDIRYSCYFRVVSVDCMGFIDKYANKTCSKQPVISLQNS